MNYQPSNSDLIESLEEQVKACEYSMDVHARVVHRIKDKYPELSEKFNDAYTAYSDEMDTTYFPKELLDAVIDAINNSTEPKPPEDLLANFKNGDSMDGIKI